MKNGRGHDDERDTNRLTAELELITVTFHNATHMHCSTVVGGGRGGTRGGEILPSLPTGNNEPWHTATRRNERSKKTHNDTEQGLGSMQLLNITLSSSLSFCVIAMCYVTKCEFFNAGGSVKDHIGLRMVQETERDG